MKVDKRREFSQRSLQHHNLLHTQCLHYFIIITPEMADLSTCLLTTGTAGQVSAHTPFPFEFLDIIPKTPLAVFEAEPLYVGLDEAIGSLQAPVLPPLGVPDIPLTKWTSNNQEVSDTFPESTRADKCTKVDSMTFSPCMIAWLW